MSEGSMRAPSEVKQIEIERVIPNPDQPRKTFNQEKLAELADSIRTNGVLQPVLVRKDDPETEIMPLVRELKFMAPQKEKLRYRLAEEVVRGMAEGQQ